MGRKTELTGLGLEREGNCDRVGRKKTAITRDCATFCFEPALVHLYQARSVSIITLSLSLLFKHCCIISVSKYLKILCKFKLVFILTQLSLEDKIPKTCIIFCTCKIRIHFHLQTFKGP